MELNELMLLIRETPANVAIAVDELMTAHGFISVASRDLHEDFTPLLFDDDGGVAFVISQAKQDWLACFASLDASALWTLAEELARALEQPLLLVWLDGERRAGAYRFFDQGRLLAETDPPSPDMAEPSLPAVLQLLAEHDVPEELLHDRVEYFGEEHLGLAYVKHSI